MNLLKPGTNDTVKNKRATILPVPALGYSPETSTYVGFVTLFSWNVFHDSLTRSSNAKAEFNYTWKKQYITDLGWESFTRKEKYYFKGKLTFSRYPDLYYGIGEDTPEKNITHYDSRRRIIDISLLRALRPKIFLGATFRLNKYDILNYRPETYPDYPELAPESNTGAGLRFMIDKRNNLLNTTLGFYGETWCTYNTNDQKEYYKFGIDSRYFNTFEEKHTVALRLLGIFTFNEAPFYDLALMGGDNQVRGFLYGRYRDNNLFTFQSEYRSVIYKRWGYALFGGVSKVNHNIEGLTLKNTKLNYGAGIRFMIDRKERINLRLDYARGSGGSDGFYISFGESF
ncbi:MAG: BamA/TamA family outer membrane protein [Bacteroidales bacterium]